MTMPQMLVLAALTRRRLTVLLRCLGPERRRGHPWSRSRSQRVLIEALCAQHARVLADGGYRGIPELLTPVFRGNRILRDRAWRRHRRRRARIEHAIARLKNWRVLRDHRRRGRHLLDTLKALAFLHNLHLDDLRDST